MQERHPHKQNTNVVWNSNNKFNRYFFGWGQDECVIMQIRSLFATLNTSNSLILLQTRAALDATRYVRLPVPLDALGRESSFSPRYTGLHSSICILIRLNRLFSPKTCPVVAAPIMQSFVVFHKLFHACFELALKLLSCFYRATTSSMYGS